MLASLLPALTQALAGVSIDPRDVQAIVREVDRDGNGNIDYNEFVAMMRA